MFVVSVTAYNEFTTSSMMASHIWNTMSNNLYEKFRYVSNIDCTVSGMKIALLVIQSLKKLPVRIEPECSSPRSQKYATLNCPSVQFNSHSHTVIYL
jgi:hypothetical protein